MVGYNQWGVRSPHVKLVLHTGDTFNCKIKKELAMNLAQYLYGEEKAFSGVANCKQLMPSTLCFQ